MKTAGDDICTANTNYFDVGIKDDVRIACNEHI